MALSSVAPLRGSLLRFRERLEVALQDYLGTDGFDQLIRLVDSVQLDLGRFGARQDESTRAHGRALAARMEESQRAGLFALDGELERELKVLTPLLASYLESSKTGGAA